MSIAVHLRVFPVYHQFTELYQATSSAFMVPGFPGSVVILLWYLSEAIVAVYKWSQPLMKFAYKARKSYKHCIGSPAPTLCPIIHTVVFESVLFIIHRMS